MRVFTGGPILTMDATMGATRAEAVAVAGGRIVAVGDASIVAGFPDAAVVDLGGRTLAPAFIDAHNHLSVSALQPVWGDASAIRDPAGLAAAVRAEAERAPDASWIRLAGWDESRTGYSPTRSDLDGAGVDRPVVVTHYSLHQCVVSSSALDALGIGRTTPDPPGGEIGRAPSGEPSGLLLERAWSEAHARSMSAYGDPDRWSEHVAIRARELWRDGITAIHDAACSPEAEDLYAGLAARSELPVSVVAMPHPAAILQNEHSSRLDGPPTGEGDEALRVGAMKLFADGGVAIALDTAIGGQPLRFGILMDDLERCALAAVERGFRIAVHAIGNAGVEHALATFDAARRPAGRRRPPVPARARRGHAVDAVATTVGARRHRRRSARLRRACRPPVRGRALRRRPLVGVRGARGCRCDARGFERRAVRARRPAVVRGVGREPDDVDRDPLRARAGRRARHLARGVHGRCRRGPAARSTSAVGSPRGSSPTSSCSTVPARPRRSRETWRGGECVFTAAPDGGAGDGDGEGSGPSH